MILTYRHIEQIKALAHLKSFAKAGRHLNLSQPALSRSISNLEEQLGVKLFDRKHNNVTPTLFGRYILEKGEFLLQELKLLNRDLRLLRDNQAGEVHIGCGPFPAEMFMGNAIATFHKKYPKLDLHVTVDMTPRLLPLLRERSLDVFVADTRIIQQESDLDIRLFEQQQTYFCCRKDHPLAHSQSISIGDVLEFPLAIMWIPESVVAMLQELSGVNILEASNSPSGVIKCDNFSLLLDIINSTNAIGISCRGVINKSIHSHSISLLPLQFPDFRTQFGAVSLKGCTQPPAIDYLVQCLSDAAKHNN